VSSVAEIQKAILALPEPEAWQLGAWLNERLEDAWDRQIEGDAKSGRLDSLWQQAETEIEQGGLRPLDEILDDPRFS
jgi:hypothetical protein